MPLTQNPEPTPLDALMQSFANRHAAAVETHNHQFSNLITRHCPFVQLHKGPYRLGDGEFSTRDPWNTLGGHHLNRVSDDYEPTTWHAYDPSEETGTFLALYAYPLEDTIDWVLITGTADHELRNDGRNLSYEQIENRDIKGGTLAQLLPHINAAYQRIFPDEQNPPETIDAQAIDEAEANLTLETNRLTIELTHIKNQVASRLTELLGIKHLHKSAYLGVHDTRGVTPFHWSYFDDNTTAGHFFCLTYGDLGAPWMLNAGTSTSHTDAMNALSYNDAAFKTHETHAGTFNDLKATMLKVTTLSELNLE